MKIGILGYGKEGKSAEQYFSKRGDQIEIFDNFTSTELTSQDFSKFDLILRSPSVHPQPGFSSMTRYFFDYCPCPIIGITGTKGKGTTCSLITDLLKNLHHDVHLVGNIGHPALDSLDQLTTNSIVVYEMSSFQLWDLEKSPHIAVILSIEPDHLNVHDNFEDYRQAKANICKYQSPSDFCIYYQNNSDSCKIASTSSAQKLPYPTTDRTILDEILNHLAIPGRHNRDNAEAALLAVASFYDLSLSEFISQYHNIIIHTLENFRGLPHRLEFLRELDGVKYYDDNFCTNISSLEVALKAFPDQNIILIAGGRDKTNNQDLADIISLIKTRTTKTILIGESGHEIAKILTNTQISSISDADLAHLLTNTTNNHFFLASSLSQALNLAQNLTEDLATNSKPTIVLMSPAAASFDMFESVYDRGAQFQKLVRELH